MKLRIARKIAKRGSLIEELARGFECRRYYSDSERRAVRRVALTLRRIRRVMREVRAKRADLLEMAL